MRCFPETTFPSRSSGCPATALPSSVRRLNQAIHCSETFCISSGDRLFRKSVPRNNSMYPFWFCVLIACCYFDLDSNVCELFLWRRFTGLGIEGTFPSYGSDFDYGAIGKSRVGPRDCNCFFHGFHVQQQVTTNGFLGLGERTIGYRLSIFARNNCSFSSERLAVLNFSLRVQSVEPGFRLADHVLNLVM